MIKRHIICITRDQKVKEKNVTAIKFTYCMTRLGLWSLSLMLPVLFQPAELGKTILIVNTLKYSNIS